MTTTDPTARNVEIAREYLALLQAGDGAAVMGRLMHPEVEQEELPNAIFPRGMKRDLAGLSASFEKGRGLLAEQRYDVVNVVAADDQVVLEFVWTGTLAVDAGPMRAGEVLRARCVHVLELREQRIFRQRSYDCYDPR